MPIMNAVMGGVGAGVQPKDNPDPSGPTTSPTTEMLANSLPQATPPPQPSQAPNPLAPQQPASPAPGVVPRETQSEQPKGGDVVGQEAKDVDSLFNKLKEKAPKSDEDKKKELDSFMSGIHADASDTDPNMPVLGERKPGESWLTHQMSNLPDTAKFIGAQMRAHLGTNPLQQRQAFESMYGDDNVKAVGNSLYFRPGKDEKFRKIDQALWNPIADFMTSHALQAIPLAANVLTQGAVDLGSVAGAPESGGVSLGGVAAAGAAGGAAEAGTRQSLQAVLNLFSSKPQTQTLNDIGSDVGTSAAVNAVGAPVASAVMGVGRQAIGKVASALAESPAIATATEQAAGWATTKAAMVRNAFKDFVDVIHPGAMDKAPEEFVSGLKGAFDKAYDRLGTTVGAIKAEVKSIAQQQGIKAPVDNSIKAIKDMLFDHGYAVDSSGDMSLANSDALNLAKPDVKTALENLKNHFNVISNQAVSDGGVTAEDIFRHTTDLGNLAKFDKGAMVSDDATALYRKAWKATVEDRNQFINQAYKGSQSSYADTWAAEFSKYHDQIGSVNDFRSALAGDGQRENFFKALTSGEKSEQANMIDAAKNILEPDSKEWRGLQGQLVNHLVDKFSAGGPVNTNGLLKYMTNPDNASVISRIMEPQDQLLFKKMILESSKVDQTAKLAEPSKNVIVDGVKRLFHMGYDPLQSAYNTMIGLGGSKVQLDYLLDDGFNKMINEAEGPGIKKSLMEGRRLLEGLTDKMQVVDMPSTLEKGVRKSVKRYAPMISSPGSRQYIEDKLGGYNPGAASGPGDSDSESDSKPKSLGPESMNDTPPPSSSSGQSLPSLDQGKVKDFLKGFNSGKTKATKSA